MTGSGVTVEEVPAPGVEDGTVIVAVDHSCISAGTELSGIGAAETPLWRRALRDPSKVAAAARLVAQHGLVHTRQVVVGQAAVGTPIGYSAAGVVTAVGRGIDDLTLGDRVACAGAGVANHAEVIRVPRNLCVPVPDEVGLADASTVTLGAIALQGVRRAAPTLGETVLVLGLGVLGQLAVQMLRANGCRVAAADVDASRVDLACRHGADVGLRTGDDDVVERLARLTDDCGVDAVVITAATPSDEVVSTAFRSCRKKGRVVLVGDVGLALRRSEIYEKELDFLVSTSYGPGRYDRRYEEDGLDYPIGQVRWTENRNMGQVVRLLATGRLAVAPLVSAVVPVERAPEAYRRLREDTPRPLMVLLRYPDRGSLAATRKVAVGHTASRTTPAARPGRLRIGLIGAGGFARTVHLPNIQALRDQCELRAVVSRTGHNASAVARQFGAAWSGTDGADVLADPEIDAVIVATRHDHHAQLVRAALEAGKHVLVEKPLALSRAELDEVRSFYDAPGEANEAGEGTPGEQGRGPLLLTGFNRRFSFLALRLRDLLAAGGGPSVLTYRMNAGRLPESHWVHGPEGGGRNIGEACHIYDLFTFLTGSPVIHVDAVAANPADGYYRRDDNFVASMTFADGTVASLTYSAMGSVDVPKERLEAFSGGRVLVLDDWRELTVSGVSEPSRATQHDKGHRAELEAFVRAVRQGGPWPIPLWQQVQATETSFCVQDAIAGGCQDRPA